MHIKISKSSLSEALNNVATVVTAKTSLPVLQNVKIDAKDGQATFVCSDLDTTLIATASCEVIEEGATTIPVKTFAAAVSKVVDGTVELKVDDKDVAKLSAGTSRFSFRGISAAEFPTLNDIDGEAPARLSCSAIREILRKTSFAMSTDDTRATLKSVYLDFSKGGGKTTAVATDGRRLAILNCIVEVPEGFNSSFVLPSRAVDVLLKKLPKDGDCNIVSLGNQLKFSTPQLTLCTKLIDDAYPNYMQVVPKNNDRKVVIDRAEFAGAIDRISVFTNINEVAVMVLVFGDNKVVLTSAETDYGSSRDEVPIKYDGDPIEIKFNPQYFRDVLNVMDEDEVEILLSASSGPAIVRKVDSDEYTYVVMPLRV